jgi:hypothetical protein
MKDIVYWCGHHTFGDAFCLCAAAQLKSLETKTKIKVSYWGPFKELSTYFDNIEYIEEDQLTNYTRVDCGLDPYDNTYKFNGVTRFLRFMTDNKEILSCGKILLNVSQYLNNNTISICANGNVNGLLSKDIFRKMLERSKLFYPNSNIQFIGHFSINIEENYNDLILEYNIRDNRTHDRTGHFIIEQLRKSSLVIGVHTGPLFPALGLGVPVWCENSKNLYHNYLLDFPNNKPFFFV